MTPLHSASSAARSSPSSPSHSLPPQPSSTITAVGRECAKCLSYLTRALDGGGGEGTVGIMSASSSSSSRPATLLRALGVISPIHERKNGDSETNYDNNNNSNNNRGGSKNDISNNENKFYELTPNGRGVMIRLENNHNKKNNNKNNNNNSEGSVCLNKEHDYLQSRESTVGVSRDDAQRQSEQQNQPQPQPQPIHRRLSNAALHLANNIQGSRHIKGVLTTSPLSALPLSTTHTVQCNSSTQDSSSTTTITIECSPCGSDTRAEACARAYVRGPDPLGIVLCSNRLSSQREIEEVLVHELVHIYDVHVRQMDLRDCKQLAYSEVRAAREAECGNR